MKNNLCSFCFILLSSLIWSSCVTTNKQDFAHHKYLEGAKKTRTFSNKLIPIKFISKKAILRKLPDLLEQDKALINSLVSQSQINELEQSAMANNVVNDPSLRLFLPTDKSLVLPNKPTQAYSKSRDDQCDEMIMRNGDIKMIKTIEIGVSEIKYKKCENLTGPVYSVLKSEVFMIKYVNGSKDVFKEDKKNAPTITPTIAPVVNKDNYYTTERSHAARPIAEGFGITSFILGLSSFLIGWYVSGLFGIIMGILAIIFGAIGMNRIANNKDKYTTSRGLAVVGFLTGLFSSLILILTIASLL